MGLMWDQGESALMWNQGELIVPDVELGVIGPDMKLIQGELTLSQIYHFNP